MNPSSEFILDYLPTAIYHPNFIILYSYTIYVMVFWWGYSHVDIGASGTHGPRILPRRWPTGGQPVTPRQRFETATLHTAHAHSMCHALAMRWPFAMVSPLLRVCFLFAWKSDVFKLMLEEYDFNSLRNSLCNNLTWCFALLPSWQACYPASSILLTI
jgi:hypothetical protein